MNNPVSDSIEPLPTGAYVKFSRANGDPLPTVFLAHGWKGQPNDEMRGELRNIGFHSVSLGFRGHGSAHGDITKVTRAEHLEDLQALLAWARERPEIDMEHLGAFGSSYGAYMLATFAPEAPFKFMAFRAPALYPDFGWERPVADLLNDTALRAWRTVTHQRVESHALQGLAAFTGRLLMVTSGEDEDMPPTIVKSYRAVTANASKCDSRVIQRAGHVLKPQERLQFNRIFHAWLMKQRTPD